MTTTYQFDKVIYGIPYPVEIEANNDTQALIRAQDTITPSQAKASAAVINERKSTVPKGH